MEVQRIQNDWSQMPTGLLYYFIGPPKTGKTTQASRWSTKGSEGVILLDTDMGADFVDNANIIPITSLAPPLRNVLDKNGKAIVTAVNGRETVKTEKVPPEQRGYCYRTGKKRGTPMPVYSLIEAIDWLKINWKDLPYDTIAIDTVDKINEWQEELIKERFCVEAIADVEMGKGWTIPKDNLLSSIYSLKTFIRNVGGTLVITSHSKDTITVDKKVQLVPDIPKGLGKGLCKMAEVIGFTTCNKANGKFYISFTQYEERNIGSRLEPLKNKRFIFDYKVIEDEIKRFKKEK